MKPGGHRVEKSPDGAPSLGDLADPKQLVRCGTQIMYVSSTALNALVEAIDQLQLITIICNQLFPSAVSEQLFTPSVHLPVPSPLRLKRSGWRPNTERQQWTDALHSGWCFLNGHVSETALSHRDVHAFISPSSISRLTSRWVHRGVSCLAHGQLSVVLLVLIQAPGRTAEETDWMGLTLKESKRLFRRPLFL